MSEKKTGLELLREPFPPNQVGKLAKGSKAQTQCKPEEKANCKVCGGWHHPKMIHLDYVGHAALTDRLLDADPGWFWEPLAYRDGLPGFDASGGLWIKLTICGVTRLGYGHAPESEYKEIGSRDKEVIGDALRNAAMRFGAALELWHKGELHVEEEAKPKGDSPGKIIEQEIAGDGMLPEVREGIRIEAKAIETDFYTINGKAGVARWKAFEKDANEQEVAFCWSLIHSTVRSGIKKIMDANLATA